MTETLSEKAVCRANNIGLAIRTSYSVRSKASELSILYLQQYVSGSKKLILVFYIE